MAAGYAAGSVYGADSEQLVHKSPSATYAAVEDVLGNIRPSGTTSFEGGTPMPYRITVDHLADQHLLISLSFNGQNGVQAELDFVPQNEGKETLIVSKIHSDRAVLRSALAGTSKARLAYAPDWMLNLTVRPLLQKLAAQIEEGGSARGLMQGWMPGEGQAEWEANLSAEQREELSQAQQYEATQPALDPNSDAERYAGGESGNSAP
jgi:hypothetical protein